MSVNVTKLGVFSFARLQAFILGIIGLVAGVIYSLGGLIIDTLVTLELITSSETSGLSYGTLLAFGALLGMPIISAVIGFIFGLIESLIFNLFAKWIGGVTIKFSQ